MADEVKSGYVHKCGKSVKSWKRRWFVLKQNGYLYYYTDSSAKVEKGKIDIVDAAGVTPYSDKTKGAETPPSNLGTANAFLIITKERVFTCVCETLDECRSWVSALEKIRGVVSADQHYPPPTYPTKSPGGAPPMTPPSNQAPPAYTPQPPAPYPPQRGPPMPMPAYNTAPPPQPQPHPRPPAGPGYAGAQNYPPGPYQPRPPVQQYNQPPPPGPPMLQPQRPPVAGYPPPRQPRPASYPAQPYAPRPAPPPAAYYPPQQQYYRPQPVVRQQHTTTVTVVSVPPPQQRVIIRR